MLKLRYFNSHSRKESDSFFKKSDVRARYFNSHSRKESDLITSN